MAEYQQRPPWSRHPPREGLENEPFRSGEGIMQPGAAAVVDYDAVELLHGERTERPGVTEVDGRGAIESMMLG